MAKERLDMWIPSAMKADLKDIAEREKSHMSSIVEEELERGIARRKGETIEQQALPIIREIVQTELMKALAQLRMDMREDILQEIRTTSRRSDDRLAPIVVRTLRESEISRRLVYALLERLVSAQFATMAYDEAREETGKDLRRPTAALQDS